MKRAHIRYSEIGKVFPRGDQVGNLIWALIAARNDLAVAFHLIGARDELVPLIHKGQPFEGEGEFFVRSYFFRNSLAAIKSIGWLINRLQGEAQFRALLGSKELKWTPFFGPP